MGERRCCFSDTEDYKGERFNAYSFVNCLRTFAEKDDRRKRIVIIVNGPVIIIENLLILDGGNLLKFYNLLSP
jgi:hypothetical protein